MAASIDRQHTYWFMLRIAFAAIAVLVAFMEPWDANDDGHISLHEVLLFPVRFLAFPVHLLLRLTPASVLQALDLPVAQWPSSALFAVLISLPLWGLFLIGGLIVEALLERDWKVRHDCKQ
jgi:hypothetical protein